MTAADRYQAEPRVDWAALLAQHDRWLRMVLWTRLTDREAVDEVLQEVALAAVRQSAPLDDVTKAAPWLYRLAVRQVLLYRRRCGRQRKRIDRYAELRQPREYDNRESDPLHWLLSKERQQMVRVALEQLPSRDAEMLLLKYAEQWNYQQIAEHLGISHSAVETRLFRARQKLRDVLSRTAESSAPETGLRIVS